MRSAVRVLALAVYPMEAAATRFRLCQLVEPLARRGIHMTVMPFLDSSTFASLYQRSTWPRTALGVARATFARLADGPRIWDCDVLLVQREAAMGPPIFEWLGARVRRAPLVLDLDDPTYITQESPVFPRLGKLRAWPGKADSLIGWASVVTCGNRTIADHVMASGTRAVVVPTVVDTGVFSPGPRSDRDEAPLVGWIGSHSAYPYLETVLPVLSRLADRYRFRLKVVGSGRPSISVPGVDVETLPWVLEREVADFRSLDIGLYPLHSDAWSRGKSGLKSVQYMAAGVPFVVNPVGAAAKLGESGVTHLTADSPDEWADALGRLLGDAALRARMGAAGRQHVLRHYTVDVAADGLASALQEALA